MRKPITNQMQRTALIEAMRTAGTKLGTFKTTAYVSYALWDGVTSAWYAIDKATIPAALRHEFPVFFFGNFDFPVFRSGFEILPESLKGIYPFTDSGLAGPTLGVWRFMGVHVFGNIPENVLLNYIIPDITVTPLIEPKLGDMIFIYGIADAVNIYRAFVILTSERNYNSLVKESSYKPITTRNIVYYSDNVDQFNNTIHLTTYDQTGNYKDTSYNPLTDKPAYTTGILNVLTLNLQLQINRYLGLYTRIKFATPLITFEYNFRY
jgi:hypothetical protein